MSNITNAGTPFGDGFNIQVAAPVDYRMIVENKSELTSNVSYGNGIYAYKGMIVTVKDDDGAGNPATYQLKTSPLGFTSFSNWTKFSTGSNLQMSDLFDVDITSAQSGDILVYDNATSSWYNYGPVVEAIFDAGTQGIGYRKTDGEIGYIGIDLTNVYQEDTEYVSNNFIIDGQNYNQSLSNLDDILGILAPSQPDTLLGKGLNYSGPTRYNAKVSRSLPASWYLDGVQAGDTISGYIVSNSYTLNTPNTSDTFNLGKFSDQSTWPDVVHLKDGSNLNNVVTSTGSAPKSNTVSNANGTSELTLTTVDAYPTANPLWAKGNASLDYTQNSADNGQIKHAIQVDSNATDETILYYDDVAASATLNGSITISEVSIVNKFLSGISYYGTGTQLRIQYDSNVGIFNKAYHSTAVSTIDGEASPVLNINPGDPGVQSLPGAQAIPRYDDYHRVNRIITLSEGDSLASTVSFSSSAGVSTGKDPGNVEVILRKPNSSNSYDQDMAKPICTYGIVSTNTSEYFYDENQRFYLDTTTSFVSASSLPNGEAQVANGSLIYGNADYPSKSGNQCYQRRFVKASASNGTLQFSGISISDVSSFGTGSLNILLYLEDDDIWFDLGLPFGAINGTGDGSSRTNSAGGQVGTSSGSNLNWTIGTNSTAFNNSRYRIEICFRDNATAKSLEINRIISS